MCQRNGIADSAVSQGYKARSAGCWHVYLLVPVVQERRSSCQVVFVISHPIIDVSTILHSLLHILQAVCLTGKGVMPAAQAYLVLASVVCHCNYTHEDLLFTQVCSDPTPIHCNTGFGKKHYPLLSAAPQNRLRADLCHCKCTYEDLLFIQVCRDPQPMQCTTGFGEKHSPLLSAALENRLTAALCHCNYTHEDLLFMLV